jgi:hypothetical protein
MTCPQRNVPQLLLGLTGVAALGFVGALADTIRMPSPD